MSLLTGSSNQSLISDSIGDLNQKIVENYIKSKSNPYAYKLNQIYFPRKLNQISVVSFKSKTNHFFLACHWQLINFGVSVFQITYKTSITIQTPNNLTRNYWSKIHVYSSNNYWLSARQLFANIKFTSNIYSI